MVKQKMVDQQNIEFVRYCSSTLAKIVPCCVGWHKIDWDSNLKMYIRHNCFDEPASNFCSNLIHPKFSNIIVKNGDIKCE